MSGNDKNDLTRIEDLSEFVHEENEDLDLQFENLSESQDDEAGSELPPEPSEETDAFIEPETPETLEDDEDFSFEDENSFEQEQSPSDFFETEDSEETEIDTSATEITSTWDDEEALDFEDALDSQDDVDNQELVPPDFFDDQLDQESLDEVEVPEEISEEEPLDSTQFDLADETVEENHETTQPEEDHELLNSIMNEETEDEQVTQDLEITKSKPESFDDVKGFMEQSTFGKVSIGGNPPFSILMNGISTQDADSIKSILNEVGLLKDNELLYSTSIENGHLLIPQLPEFCAVYLANKLRKYCVEISMGLASEIHQSKSYEDNDARGLTSSRSIEQNTQRKYIRDSFNISDIQLSTSDTILGQVVKKTLGPMQINEKIDNDEFNDIESIDLIEFFSERIRNEAMNIGANAVVSIQFNIGNQKVDGREYSVIMAHGNFVITRNI